MSDTHPGFDDHHQLKRHAQPRLDPSKLLDRKIADTAWDIINGRAPTIQDAPNTVTVPHEYVQAIAWHMLHELKRRSCTKGFSVKVNPDLPEVDITWERTGGLVTPNGNAYRGVTNCLAAFIDKRDPQHVGIEAVETFLQQLAATLGAQG